MFKQLVSAVLEADIPLTVKVETLLFILFFPHVFQSLVAFRTTLIEYGTAIRRLDTQTETLWRILVAKSAEKNKPYIG